MFKTTAIDTLKQDKKCQACWYIILSTMSGSTTAKHSKTKGIDNFELSLFGLLFVLLLVRYNDKSSVIANVILAPPSKLLVKVLEYLVF